MKILSEIILMIVLGIGAGVPAALAQKEEDFLHELDNIRNPFLSYLVKKQETPPPAPVVPTPPVLHKPRVEPTPPLVVIKPVRPSPQEIKNDASFMQNLKLNGVIWDTDMPQAIISHKEVRERYNHNADNITTNDKNADENTRNAFK